MGKKHGLAIKALLSLYATKETQCDFDSAYITSVFLLAVQMQKKKGP